MKRPFELPGIQKIPAVKSLVDKVTRKTIEIRLPKDDMVLPCHGLRIRVRSPRASLIGQEVYLHGSWEAEVTQFISSQVQEGMSVLDVGADVGYYTILFSRLVGPTGKVFAFEPIPKAKSYLDDNVGMNELENVKTFDYALFDEDGYVCLEDPLKKSQLNVHKTDMSDNDIRVRMKVFDQAKDEDGIENVDLVKLDVEGAEVNVLKGMKDTITRSHPKILVEVHPEQLRSFESSPYELMAYLSAFDYSIQPVDKSKLNFFDGNITLFCQ